MVMAVLVSEQQLYHFFRELAEPLDPNAVPAAPKPEVMQRLFEVAALSVLDRLTIRERSHWDKSGMTLRGSSKPMEVLALPHQPTNCAE
jgi:hypothetical protein